MLHLIHTAIPVIISAYDSGWYFGPFQEVTEAMRTILESLASKGKK